MSGAGPIAFSAAGTSGAAGAKAGKGGSARPKLEHAYLELRTPPTGGGLTPAARAGGSTSSSTPRN